MMAVREHSSRRYPDLFKDEGDEEQVSSAAEVTNVEDAIAAEASKEKEKVQEGPFGLIDTKVTLCLPCLLCKLCKANTDCTAVVKTKGLLFVEFHDQKMDPVDVCADCLKEVRDTGRTKTKYLVRATPVLATCYAKYEDILKATKPLIEKYLSSSMEATSYCIVYKKRSNEELDRLELIKKIADLVDKKHTVELTMPKKTILVDVLMNVCCIGVCDDYFALRKYNVQVGTAARPRAHKDMIMLMHVCAVFHVLLHFDFAREYGDALSGQHLQKSAALPAGIRRIRGAHVVLAGRSGVERRWSECGKVGSRRACTKLMCAWVCIGAGAGSGRAETCVGHRWRYNLAGVRTFARECMCVCSCVCLCVCAPCDRVFVCLWVFVRSCGRVAVRVCVFGSMWCGLGSLSRPCSLAPKASCNAHMRTRVLE